MINLDKLKEVEKVIQDFVSSEIENKLMNVDNVQFDNVMELKTVISKIKAQDFQYKEDLEKQKYIKSIDLSCCNTWVLLPRSEYEQTKDEPKWLPLSLHRPVCPNYKQIKFCTKSIR